MLLKSAELYCDKQHIFFKVNLRDIKEAIEKHLVADANNMELDDFDTSKDMQVLGFSNTGLIFRATEKGSHWSCENCYWATYNTKSSLYRFLRSL